MVPKKSENGLKMKPKTTKKWREGEERRGRETKGEKRRRKRRQGEKRSKREVDGVKGGRWSQPRRSGGGLSALKGGDCLGMPPLKS